MDAKELTKRHYDLEGRVVELEKMVEYLNQEFQKQRMFIKDMEADIKGLEFHQLKYH